MPQFCEASTLSQPGATSWGGVGILVHRLRPQWHDHKLHLLFLSAMARSFDSIHHVLIIVLSAVLRPAHRPSYGSRPQHSLELQLAPTGYGPSQRSYAAR